MKRTILFSCAVFLMTASQAIGDGWWWPPENIDIVLQNPSPSITVSITLSGQWPDNGIPVESSISVSGNNIYFDVVSNHGPFTVITPWQLTKSAGPLAPGTYTVYTKLLGDPFVPETYTQVAEFIVADGFWSVIDVQIEPQNPTSADIVNITVSGQWHDSCVPNASYISVDGNEIYFSVISNLSENCLQVITPWQLTESVGPLSAGTYSLYASLDSVPWTLMTEFTVAETTTYVFVPGQSTVHLSGGFAGHINETHSIEGQLQLIVDFDAGTASFDSVDANLSEGGLWLGEYDLGTLFYMTELVGTVISDTQIYFEGLTQSGLTDYINCEIIDDSIHMTGYFWDGAYDGIFYDMNAIALKKYTAGEVSWIPGQTSPSGWSVNPNYASISDTIHFSGPTAIFGNSCEAALDMGYPKLTFDPVNKTIELWFQPPTHDICPAVVNPVCGLEGSFGPLETGQWLFFGNDPNAAFALPFEVVVPGDIDDDNDVDFADFAAFRAKWLDTGCGVCGRADLTGDGNVDYYDLKEFGDIWLTGAAP